MQPKIIVKEQADKPVLLSLTKSSSDNESRLKEACLVKISCSDMADMFIMQSSSMHNIWSQLVAEYTIYATMMHTTQH